MIERTLTVERATPRALAPFGLFVGVHPDAPAFARWDGVTVLGPVPISAQPGGELLHVQMEAARFPARVRLLERHPRHTQTYLSANGKPFVMVLGRGLADGLPDLSRLRAFLFEQGAGIVMRRGAWHEFPLAIEDDTRFTVILRSESHRNDLEAPEHPMDARGPDLERFDMQARARIFVGL